MVSKRYLFRIRGIIMVSALLAGCSRMISDDSPKTQVPSVETKLEKTRPRPLAKKQLSQKVALLLPLSGKEAALGQAMKNAAELSLFDNAEDSLELLVKDTQSTPEGAASSAQEAIDQGAQLILGPIFSQEVRSVVTCAYKRKVPVVSFSSDSSVAGNGNYIMGFSPQEQIKRVTSFARSQGVDRLIVIAPSTPYGSLVISTLTDLAAKGQTTMVAKISYTGKGENLARDLEKLKGLSFNGIILPVGGEELKILLANMQSFNFDFSKVRLLGTGLWDTSETQDIPLLSGAWYASVEPSQRMSFEARFQQSYGSIPSRIATLAYDGVYLASVLGRQNLSRPFHKDLLTRSEGFKGIDGLFRLKAQGETQRALAILEITPPTVHVISVAENHF